ncbi:uncharacterized protein G2W53_018474 [Senna tora]|uniref:Uncharacterized protein n=1 Tax=Senna tora TaxID=362788 RepID=A0A834TRU6_9FABA|nr:uncharacterized protein G2W53_018474 [Senna tora]
MTLQDSNKESSSPSSEDKDLQYRSKKNSKLNDNGETIGGEDDENKMKETSVSGMDVSPTKEDSRVPYEEKVSSPMATSPPKIGGSQDVEMEESSLDPKAKRALWAEEEKRNDNETSYKEKLLGFNGRCEGHISEEEEDCDSQESEEDMEESEETEDELIYPTLKISQEERNNLYKDYPPKPVEVGSEAFRPWMISPRRTRRRQRQLTNLNQTNGHKLENEGTSKSRFEVLNNLEDDVPQTNSFGKEAGVNEEVLIPHKNTLKENQMEKEQQVIQTKTPKIKESPVEASEVSL